LHHRQSAYRGSPNVTKNLEVAGFEVIISGHFWVIAKVVTSGEWDRPALVHSDYACRSITMPREVTTDR